eukprot:951303_1
MSNKHTCNEQQRQKSQKLLLKICSKILEHPNTERFQRLNYTKISDKLSECRPCISLLIHYGFCHDVNTNKLIFDSSRITELEEMKNRIIESQQAAEQLQQDNTPQWPCTRCTFLNPPNTSQCAACDNPKQSMTTDGTSPWKCLFCTSLNESTATACAQCERAHTAAVNINQICLCGRNLIEIPVALTQCFSCCKITEQKANGYCGCSARDCTFIQMAQQGFRCCSTCYGSVNSTSIDSKHSFLFSKMASIIQQTQKETKQCTDNDERRRYMDCVHTLLSQNTIAKLQGFMNESEYKEMCNIFDAFYGEVMDQIRQNIDSKELGLSSDIFVNKKNMNQNLWRQLSQTSMQWQLLADEHKYEKEKDEKVSEFDGDVCCGDPTKCQIRKRIQLVMHFYKKHFFKRFVYGDEDADEVQYIELFENALNGYSA